MAERVALVTGGNRGIGDAVVRALKEDGFTVVGTSRSGACPAADRAMVLDVTSEESVDTCVDQILQEFGRIDVLVNNAGASASAPLIKTDNALWQSMLDVNLTGTFLMMRAVLPHMLSAGSGRIVNVASTAAKSGAPYIAAYAAAKHGVLGLTRCAALEVAARGITVNAVCPSYVDTDMTEATIGNIVNLTGKSAEEAKKIIEEMSPQKRLLQPEEVADAVRYLVSPAASGINGQGLNLDGGENPV
jgi:NAD(P)-dependent dehydrogenase (short-subunit alcohol dehydrogenase family)